ncbi:MAG: hypothetical protein V2A58_13735 [Planctomycetota bacterium]
MIIATLTVVLIVGALASAVVALHVAVFRRETIGRARAQAALAARGGLEVARHAIATGEMGEREIAFSNGTVKLGINAEKGRYRVAAAAAFESEDGVEVRRTFEAVLLQTDSGLKLVGWEELPASPDEARGMLTQPHLAAPLPDRRP